jgi:hypothetical protein
VFRIVAADNWGTSQKADSFVDIVPSGSRGQNPFAAEMRKEIGARKDIRFTFSYQEVSTGLNVDPTRGMMI